MVSVYLDTSALVKLYLEEEGTARVMELTEDPDVVQMIILVITLIESRSAVRRRQREGNVSGADADRILKQMEEEASASYHIQSLTDAVMEEAARLIDRHPLRAYDALQLAGCLIARQNVPGTLTFVCADTRLCEAARSEGLTTLNPLSP